MPDEQVAAALDAIRAHADMDGPRFNPGFTCDVHVPRLVAAVEAALKLADEWEADSFIVDPEIPLRAAITAALQGEESGDGG